MLERVLFYFWVLFNIVLPLLVAVGLGWLLQGLGLRALIVIIPIYTACCLWTFLGWWIDIWEGWWD